MKKIMIIALCILVLFSFASCNTEKTSELPAFEYDGREIEYDLATLKGNNTWGEAKAYIDGLNQANYGGHNDWRLFESEEEVMAWWENGGKEAYESNELTPVYIIRSDVESKDDTDYKNVYNWYCDDENWVSESKGEYDAVIGCFAVRGRN